MSPLLVFDVDAVRPGISIDPAVRIGDGEPLGHGIRRMSVALLDRAIGELAVAPGDRASGVHDARKALKRVRALIRLVRDTVGYRPYREINVVLRDAARYLAPVRDDAVMVEVVDRLVGGNRLDSRRAAVTRDLLSAMHTASSRRVLDDAAGFAGTLTALRVARRLLAAWPVDDAGTPLAVPDDFSSIAGGLRRVYRRGRNGLLRSGEQMDAAAFHEWRKRVKYLRHQIEALQGAWPDVMGPTAAALDTLGETLGEEHDLEVFRTVLAGRPGFPDSERGMLVSLAAAEQCRLRAEALGMGRRLYAETPSRFVARIEAYWEAWRPASPLPSRDGPIPGR